MNAHVGASRSDQVTAMFRTVLKIIVALVILWIIVFIPSHLAKKEDVSKPAIHDTATEHLVESISGMVQIEEAKEATGPASNNASEDVTHEGEEKVMYEREIAEYVKTFYIA